MKCVLIGLLGGLGAIAVLPSVGAQTVSSPTGMVTRPQSSLLTTQPIEIQQVRTGQLSGLDATTLNSVANSIQAYPVKPDGGGMPSTIIPADLIHTPSRVLPETHPLETFQPPAPNRSVGINLNRL